MEEGKSGKAEPKASADSQAGSFFGGAEPFLPDGWANILCILIGVGGGLYGRRQAEFRRSVVERYHPLMVEYEKRLDPDRVSSDMPPRGGTRLEDA
ncbi:hypothetical protein D9M71_719310 [compost metagenome]